MKKFTPWLFFLTITTVCNAYGEVVIKLPGNTETLLLNEKAISGKTLTNDNGPQQLVFKLLSSYRAHGVQTRYSSEAIILSFDAADNEYTIKLPPITSSKEGDAFNKQPDLALQDNKGNGIDYKIDTLRQEGIQLGRDYQQEIQAYNQSQGAAVMTFSLASVDPLPTVAGPQSQTLSLTQPLTQASIPTNVGSTQEEVGKMLDYWYSQADDRTREAFKKRISLK
ncbi:DUF2057 domain-containing protein [Shewanella sp. AS1]|uniref:DUF2057 domain-containing protein n=1 Tax=Shewanella sp. AS1 TaxID=2907626 RepID=UPI001F1B7DE6|nr:DUF2057 domain-containing protein [Shewanella sp. AS1]MCE9678726.1 DUF2057 domain-containing protein [Shewanella sp. AS1]